MPGVHVIEMTPEEQERAVDTARQVAKEFDKTGEEHDRDNTYAADAVQAFRDSGLPALCVPKRFGGWGADIWTLARCVQALAYGDPSAALAVNMHLGVIGFFRGMWPEEVQARYFPEVAREGRLFDGAYSEQRAGVIGLADTVAVPADGGHRLSGRKTWATLCLSADFHTVNATVTEPDGSVPDDPATRAAREMMFVVPKDATGLSIDRTWNTMGMRSTGTETLVLDDVFVPEQDLVAREFRMPLFANLEWQTVTFASVYLGLMRRAYDETRAILRTKHSGPVLGAADTAARDSGFVQVGLGHLRYLVEATAATVENLARILNEGRDAEWGPVLRLGMLEVPKLAATENAITLTEGAGRLVGGMSYRRGHILERLYRDARSGPFHPLTTDQTIEYIGRAELGLFDPAPTPEEAATTTAG
jgi:alkylation response protein AidB-like acyl-CoA dehydrogenase